MTMVYQTMFEELLVAQGFDGLVTDHKNKLAQTLSDRYKLSIFDITPAFILEHHKKLKMQLLDETCENAIKNGFTSVNGHKYRLNDGDQINFLGQKDYLRDEPDVTSVLWRTEDAGYVDHTREDWMVVQKEAFNHKLTQLTKYNTYVQKIKNAVTDKEVYNTNWEN